MTEDEAKTKWCPFARYGGVGNSAMNRWKQMAPPEEPHALNPIPCRCIGSDCMAWRWYYDTEVNYNVVALKGKTTNGFCGLAGKP